jgi:hypothetical protein
MEMSRQPEPEQEDDEDVVEGDVQTVRQPECWLKNKLTTLISMFFLLVTAGLLISEKIEMVNIFFKNTHFSERFFDIFGLLK